MSDTMKERAKGILLSYITHPVNEQIEAIAEALRATRNEALEEAAYVAERYRDHNGHNQAHWAAKQIRALISKEAGK